MVCLTDIDHGLPAAAHQLARRRALPIRTPNGPTTQIRLIRGQAQSGGGPAGRSRSLGGHQGGGRVARRVHIATRIDQEHAAIDVANAEEPGFFGRQGPYS